MNFIKVAQKAYIFGGLNKAVTFENGEFFLLEGGRQEQKRPLTGYEWSQMKAAQAEYFEVTAESPEVIALQTRDYYRKTQALEMALELMDASFSEEYRIAIAMALVKEVEDTAVYNFVRNRLLTTPVPAAFNPQMAYSLMYSRSSRAAQLFHDLENKTEPFAHFYTHLMLHLQVEEPLRSRVNQLLTDNGIFAQFATALYAADEMQFDSAVTAINSQLHELNIEMPEHFFSEIKALLNSGRDIQLNHPIVHPYYVKREHSQEEKVFAHLKNDFADNIDGLTIVPAARIIKIILVSSNELIEDRKKFEIAIKNLNKYKINKGVFLELVVWENSDEVISKTKLQEEFNRSIGDCDIFIFLSLSRHEVGVNLLEKLEEVFQKFHAKRSTFFCTYLKAESAGSGKAKGADVYPEAGNESNLNMLRPFFYSYKHIFDLKLKFREQMNKMLPAIIRNFH